MNRTKTSETGWYRKYFVGKICVGCGGLGVTITSDSDGNPRDVHECPQCNGKRYTPCNAEAEYIVLRLDADKNARKAALAYADAVESVNSQLADDIRKIVAKIEGNPPTIPHD